ncbi:zinc finger protein 679-like [Trichogramma pretiosum]|uniref:zinc finger protein 679-like n=1 Tax=Trichogramma pretiosum TaxID=7493 RepID=UPI000C71BD25|nr:zinc finger protein 679-like [Trichogramma pretiosum]
MDKCEQKFGDSKNSINYRKTRSTEKKDRMDFTCDNNEEKFGDQHNVGGHQLIVYKSRNDYACDKCEQKFRIQSSLMRHRQMVHKCRKDETTKEGKRKTKALWNTVKKRKKGKKIRKDNLSDRCYNCLVCRYQRSLSKKKKQKKLVTRNE